MGLTQIQSDYESQQHNLHRRIDRKCQAELIRLCGKVPELCISKVIFGNGGYAISGNQISYEYDDGSGTGTIPIDTFLEFELDLKSSTIRPLLSRKTLKTLREIKSLIDWWIGVTWGADTVITQGP